MRTSPSRSTTAERQARLAGTLACLAAAGCIALGYFAAAACTSLANKKEGPTRSEIEAAKARVERAREVVIENQLQSDDDEEKEFWLSILERLGDYRAHLAERPAR